MKKILAIVLTLVLVLGLVACAGSETADNGTTNATNAPAGNNEATTNNTTNDDDKLVVGLIQQDLTHPFHLGEVEGAKVCAEKYGFELIVSSGDGDVTKQVEAFDNLLSQCDIISINTLDVTAFENSFNGLMRL